MGKAARQDNWNIQIKFNPGPGPVESPCIIFILFSCAVSKPDLFIAPCHVQFVTCNFTCNTTCETKTRVQIALMQMKNGDHVHVTIISQWKMSRRRRCQRRPWQRQPSRHSPRPLSSPPTQSFLREVRLGVVKANCY